ncbi:hypothetical protein [Sphingobium yanoikuyae]|uniref:Uncharacterized protein n=1 Tax=Sphingobium yanoikuyae TaxID=13690 RepID=A0A430BZ11_SPHYA|nr:hypothetical protein [Sphingobium yanoikuyae]RSU57988.1 hypothetical protein DAH51_07020 [Sphingobium yanoikuyae]
MTDAVKMAIEALTEIKAAAGMVRCFGLTATQDDMAAAIINRAMDALAALEQAGEPVADRPLYVRELPNPSPRIGEYVVTAADIKRAGRQVDEAAARDAARKWLVAQGEDPATMYSGLVKLVEDAWLAGMKPVPTLQRLGQEFDAGEELAVLLTKAIGDITVALKWAGKSGKIEEWTAPYVAAVNQFDAHPPQSRGQAFDGEGEAVKALEPFAKLAGPINGEADRPTYLEAISGPNGTDELRLSTLVGDGRRVEILDAEDFRRAARVLAALSSAKRGEEW